jgi:hypothetical protein
LALAGRLLTCWTLPRLRHATPKTTGHQLMAEGSRSAGYRTPSCR